LLAVCSPLPADALKDQKSDAKNDDHKRKNDKDLERHREEADESDQAFKQSDQKCDYNKNTAPFPGGFHPDWHKK
jgi:hypothetical protein